MHFLNSEMNYLFVPLKKSRAHWNGKNIFLKTFKLIKEEFFLIGYV